MFSSVTKSYSLWAVSLEHPWLKGHFVDLPEHHFCVLLFTLLLSPQLPDKVLEGKNHVLLSLEDPSHERASQTYTK